MTPKAPRERTTATAAGVYDWYLNGHHHLPCDAEAAIAAQQAFPLAGQTARYNRDFLQRAVRWMTEHGIRQFLDIGSGYPTAGNVHEIAQRYAPGTRVVYADLDPDTVEVSNRLLTGTPDATCLQGDVRDPDDILGRAELLDFAQPVGLLLVSVLPFVPGDVGPLVRRYLARLAPGSYLALTHLTPADDERIRRRQADVEQTYNAKVQQNVHMRDPDEIADLFAGTELVPPGLVLATHWHPPRGYRPGPDDQASAVLLGGVGRIP
ncbi:SAM-dependent methyltransferase [Amycolatopsis viridis]|uniref:O-methyltransferase involved in polyketide biosynthesis n=1 Tax=Amycolatopsis viridis TaxID=185678 RepID=A0ABX0SYV8_9PSEU|nr:SAM-dependent methyltransferase [Amycolatopsis viridis]NIH82163.1 O-methyltransferase involved in polyketide biosynthesis [Amycolatopsis viridis]